MTRFELPSFGKTAFNCPHCKAYAHQEWYDCYYYTNINPIKVKGLNLSFCSHCGKICVWLNKKMIFPYDSPAPFPHSDLPEEVKEIYEEARTILNISPRGAAALLRLALQKLIIHLGGRGNLNDDIAKLVKKGLPIEIQKALDIVRVIGNNAVHPGQIDLTDNVEIAKSLFRLINFITERMITQPRLIEEMYEQLPENKKEAIRKRDKAEITQNP